MTERLPGWDRWARALGALLHLVNTELLLSLKTRWMEPVLLVPAGVLFLTALWGRGFGPAERYVGWVLAGTSMLFLVSYSVLSHGIRTAGDANIPGLHGLIAAPFWWLSLLNLIFGTAAWVIIVLGRALKQARTDRKP